MTNGTITWISEDLILLRSLCIGGAIVGAHAIGHLLVGARRPRPPQYLMRHGATRRRRTARHRS